MHKIICKINDMALLEGADCHKKNSTNLTTGGGNVNHKFNNL